MSNIGLRGDSEQSANTEPISDAQLSRETLASNRQTSEDYDLLTENSRTTTDQSQHNTINDGNRSASQSTGGTHKRDKDGKQNQGRAALSIPLAHYRPAHHTPMSQSPSDSSCASARHVLNPDGSEYEDIDSAVDEAPYEDVSSHADVDSAVEYADVGGQAEAHDDISEYQGNSNQQLQLPQRAVNNVLVERRRKIILAVVASVLGLTAIITLTTALVTKSGGSGDQDQTQNNNDLWSAVTSEPHCPDSLPLSIRYKSNITLPESSRYESIQSLSVTGDGTVLVASEQPKLYLYKVEGGITYSCFVKCEIYRMKLVVWTPRGDIMCLGTEGDMAVLFRKSTDLVRAFTANSYFQLPCSTTRIRSGIIVQDMLGLQHVSVSLQGVSAIYVTFYSKGIYQSTDEGATWRHIELMPHVPGLYSYYYVFRISTNNYTDQLWICFGWPNLRLVTFNNGSLVSVRNLTKPVRMLLGKGGIDYNHPSHMLHSDQSKLIIHVMPVHRRQTHCQIQLTDSAGRPVSFPMQARISSLFVHKKPGTNNTYLYVALDFGQIVEYALLGGS